jgi:hypothetical protein
MRVKCAASLVGVLALSGAAAAQPGSNGGLMPNIYNPQSQPLSPYLNMFRGTNNPASNYYFGTRPGTVGGGGTSGGLLPGIAMGGGRGAFFPQMASGPDEIDLPVADPSGTTALPPAGHPVYFNNTMGYFPTPFGNRNGLQGTGGNRPQQPAPRRR